MPANRAAVANRRGLHGSDQHSTFRSVSSDFLPPFRSHPRIQSNVINCATTKQITADFVYVRFHGHTNLHRDTYSDDALRDWAAKFNGLLGVFVFVLFLFLFFSFFSLLFCGGGGGAPLHGSCSCGFTGLDVCI